MQLALSHPQRCVLYLLLLTAGPDVSSYLAYPSISSWICSSESAKPPSYTRRWTSDFTMWKSTRGIASLPLELLLYIANFLQASGRFACIPDLISCALVCKHWFRVFKPLIQIRALRSREELQQFVKAVMTVPRFIPSVRELTFEEDEDLWVDTVASVLPRNLINLRSITLVDFCTLSQIPIAGQHLHIAYPFSRHLARLSSSFGGITKLDLIDCGFEDLNHLLRIVCGCANLEEVHLSSCEWGYVGRPWLRQFWRANNALRLVVAEGCEKPISLLWLFANPEIQRGTRTSEFRGLGFIKPSGLIVLLAIMQITFLLLENDEKCTYSFERDPTNGESFCCTVIFTALTTLQFLRLHIYYAW